MTHGSLDKTALAGQFGDLGLQPGDRVLVHSSLRALGWVEGGAPAVVEALLAAVGPEGTVLFPALTGAASDSPAHPPCCDRRERSTWCGQIPRAVLQHSGSLRSMHPTHSVAAIGAHAGALTANHPTALTPCGEGSPYMKLADMGGRILLLGVGHDSNTTFHTAEEVAGAPYVSYPGRDTATVIDDDGTRISIETPIHRWDRPRCFESWNGALLRDGVVHRGTVGDAPCRLMAAPDLITWLITLLRRNPRALLADWTPYR